MLRPFVSLKEIPMKLQQLREEVCALHAELPLNHLVAWTSGNISARDPETGLVVMPFLLNLGTIYVPSGR